MCKGVWQGACVAVKFTVADYLDFAGASAHEAVLSKMLSEFYRGARGGRSSCPRTN